MSALAEKLLPPQGGSANAVRNQARKKLLALAEPNQRQESWKYTSLRPLQRRPLQAAASGSLAEQDWLQRRLDGIDGIRLVFLDGYFSAELSQRQQLPAGVELSFSEAGSDFPQRVSDGNDIAWFPLAALAAKEQVMQLNVAASAELQQPIHLVYCTSAATAGHAACQVRLEAGAAGEVIEHFLQQPGESGLCNVATAVELGGGARLVWHRLQEQGQGFLTSCLRVQQRQESEFNYYGLDTQGLLVRHDIQCDLTQPGAVASLSGAVLVDGKHHVDNQLRVNHQAADGSSRQRFRAVAWDRGRGVINSKVVVQPGADGSDARQSSANLLLSPHAEIDTKPELEIYADDITAAHGATVGQLDEQALFYLRSRGIPQAEARALLINAFCSEALLGEAGQPALDLMQQRLSAALAGRDG